MLLQVMQTYNCPRFPEAPGSPASERRDPKQPNMMEPNSPTPLTAKIVESGATQEHYCGSCCCSITTLYAPTSLALCLGQLAQGLSLCVAHRSACCVLRDHPKYDELFISGEDKDDVCCVAAAGEYALVKPLFLLGQKPIAKESASGCCRARRCAVPCCGDNADPDVPSSFGCYGAKCCLCFPFTFAPACCERVAPLAPLKEDAAFDPLPAAVSDLHLICHVCCCQQAAYVPATIQDAFGVEDKSMCCCLTSDVRGCQLPRTAGDYKLFLFNAGQCRCVRPQLACKGNTRTCFVFYKYALPPSDEVPCACVVCGKKLAGPEKIKDDVPFTFAKIAAPSAEAMARGTKVV